MTQTGAGWVGWKITSNLKNSRLRAPCAWAPGNWRWRCRHRRHAYCMCCLARSALDSGPLYKRGFLCKHCFPAITVYTAHHCLTLFNTVLRSSRNSFCSYSQMPKCFVVPLSMYQLSLAQALTPTWGLEDLTIEYSQSGNFLLGWLGFEPHNVHNWALVDLRQNRTEID